MSVDTLHILGPATGYIIGALLSIGLIIYMKSIK
jgi:hypothetical protein